MRSPDSKQYCFTFTTVALLFAVPLSHTNPWAAVWTTPCVLIASVLLTWGAESAQFFIAQGFALAILAWMQTLPEFAVEAVLAWKQQTTLLMANLTGALRLLTGIAWPMIYATAAFVHRRRTRTTLRTIPLARDHSVEVIGLVFPILYAFVIWWRASLSIYDACALVAFYVAYLFLLSKLPPESKESIDELERVPRSIVKASPPKRFAAIAACFVVGGTLIYLIAEPFLGSLVAVAAAVGLPSFVVIQWFAPIISEFPELASTFYFARREESAAVAVMNIASSNINQWTLLFAMLPIVFSISRGSSTAITLDAQQRNELLLTISQSLTGLLFLINMRFDWWEALAMFGLFSAQFILPPILGDGVRGWITYIFFAWTAGEILRMLLARRFPVALHSFVQTWREHVRK